MPPRAARLRRGSPGRRSRLPRPPTPSSAGRSSLRPSPAVARRGASSAVRLCLLNELQSEQDDFPAAFEAAFARLQVTLLEACEREQGWPAKVDAALRSALALAA